MFFDDVRIPQENLLGEVNQGFIYLMKELPFERFGNAVFATAYAEYMFEETKAYVKQRKAFGRYIADLQV